MLNKSKEYNQKKNNLDFEIKIVEEDIIKKQNTDQKNRQNKLDTQKRNMKELNTQMRWKNRIIDGKDQSNPISKLDQLKNLKEGKKDDIVPNLTIIKTNNIHTRNHSDDIMRNNCLNELVPQGKPDPQNFVRFFLKNFCEIKKQVEKLLESAHKGTMQKQRYTRVKHGLTTGENYESKETTNNPNGLFDNFYQRDEERKTMLRSLAENLRYDINAKKAKANRISYDVSKEDNQIMNNKIHEYNDSVKLGKKNKLMAQQRYYDTLKLQSDINKEKLMQSNKMDLQEKLLNRANLQAFKHHNPNYYAVVPGWGQNLNVNHLVNHSKKFTDIHTTLQNNDFDGTNNKYILQPDQFNKADYENEMGMYISPHQHYPLRRSLNTPNKIRQPNVKRDTSPNMGIDHKKENQDLDVTDNKSQTGSQMSKSQYQNHKTMDLRRGAKQDRFSSMNPALKKKMDNEFLMKMENAHMGKNFNNVLNSKPNRESRTVNSPNNKFRVNMSMDDHR